MERQIRARVADWQGLLEGNLHEARELLRQLLPQRLRFTPRAAGGYEITGPVALGGLLTAVVAEAPQGGMPPG